MPLRRTPVAVGFVLVVVAATTAAFGQANVPLLEAATRISTDGLVICGHTLFQPAKTWSPSSSVLRVP